MPIKTINASVQQIHNAQNNTECPFVSVIIPNYNHVHFLKQRINSVLNQTYQNFEVILLDDCSSDDSIEVFKHYEGDPHISHIVINENNSGSPFKQWEKGISLAKGELIWIAESDDDCEEKLLETLISEFNKDKECVLAFCKSIKTDIKGYKVGEEGFTYSFHMNGLEFIKKHLSRHNYVVNASSAIFKRKAWDSADRSFTYYRGCGDWILWVEISSSGNIAYNNSPLNYFRIHETNTTIQQAFSGKNESEGAKVYQFMRHKKYIGFKEEFRARLSHIYSIKYGKQHTFYSAETKKRLISSWRSTPFINCFLWIINIIQKSTGIQIIKR